MSARHARLALLLQALSLVPAAVVLWREWREHVERSAPPEPDVWPMWHRPDPPGFQAAWREVCDDLRRM